MVRLWDYWELRLLLGEADEDRAGSLNILYTETEEYMVGWGRAIDQCVVQTRGWNNLEK